jgi:predicted O-methyltransferase YrrM
MDLMQRISSLGSYLLRAKDHQRVHSPFVFDFAREVLYNKRDFQSYIQIEKRRHQLIRDLSQIEVTDLGAGSGKWTSNKRRVSEIAATSLKRKKYAQLLFRVARYFEPKNTLEFGTSLGITTAYLSTGYPSGKVYTIEGCPNIAAVAGESFSKLGLNNIVQHTGHFDEVLPNLLPQLPELDLVFIDGNHRLEPTLRYFEQTLPKANNDTVFIFDDIHWSPDMEEAWYRIKEHPRVKLSIDIYEMGFVFIREEQKEKEHFTLRF